MNSQPRLSLVKPPNASGIDLPQAAAPAGIEGSSELDSDRTRAYAADFLNWYRSENGAFPKAVNISDIRLWAEKRGVKLDASQLIQVIEACKEQLREMFPPPVLLRSREKSLTPWTDLLSRIASAERERAEKEKEEQEHEKTRKPLAKDEAERKTEREHNEIKAITVCAPAFCDQSVEKNLELKLRTGNIDPGNIAGVEQFLSELRSELKRALHKSRHPAS